MEHYIENSVPIRQITLVEIIVNVLLESMSLQVNLAPRAVHPRQLSQMFSTGPKKIKHLKDASRFDGVV